MTLGYSQPWSSVYPIDGDENVSAALDTALSSFADTAAEAPDAPCVRVADESLTFGQVDSLSDNVAATLRQAGVGAGDRVALLLSQGLHFTISVVAVWKVGGVIVPLDPATSREDLERIMADARPIVLLAFEELLEEWAIDVALSLGTKGFLLTSSVVSPGIETVKHRIARGSRRFVADLYSKYVDLSAAGESSDELKPDDLACILYASPATAGVMLTHANLVFSGDTLGRWMRLTPGEALLCVEPAWSAAGLIASTTLSHLAALPVVFPETGRPSELVSLCAQWRCTVVIASNSVFGSILDELPVDPSGLTSVSKAYTVQNPASSTLSARWSALTGQPVRTFFGVAETSAASHMCPLDSRPPIDQTTGEQSVGVPVPGAEVRVIDPRTGLPVPPGWQGELWVKGPMTSPGYWARPDLNETKYNDGYVATGVHVRMDTTGWFFATKRPDHY